MNDYILIIDTETSDKPRKMDTPTEFVNKWPYILQISWLICNRKGDIVLTRDYYINPEEEITINEDSLNLHGITLDFLIKKGIKREVVLNILSEDLKKYTPMLVGHFLRFDIKMLEVGFNRAGIVHNLEDRPKFCTMFFTRSYTQYTQSSFLRLNDFYKMLFDKEFKDHHNAWADALATKECFFELLKSGKITSLELKKQEKYFDSYNKNPFHKKGLFNLFAILIMVLISILFVLSK